MRNGKKSGSTSKAGEKTLTLETGRDHDESYMKKNLGGSRSKHEKHLTLVTGRDHEESYMKKDLWNVEAGRSLKNI